MIILKLEKNKNKLNFTLSNDLRKNTIIKGAEAIVLGKDIFFN
jgi:Asp/Glu/hydantoin racemase